MNTNDINCEIYKKITQIKNVKSNLRNDLRLHGVCCFKCRFWLSQILYILRGENVQL